MNRKDLARAMARDTHLSKRQAENLIIAFGAVIGEALNRNEKVIYSNFGSFYVIEYPSKTINHPKGGHKLIMLPTRVVKWMPSDSLKKSVGANDSYFEDQEHEELNVQPETSGVEVAIKVEKSLDQPDKIQEDAIRNAHHEDDIEKYHQHTAESRHQPVNIFEEILSDGGREFSTVEGSIKAHKAQDSIADQNNNQPHTDDHLTPLDKIRTKLGFGHNSKNQEDSAQHDQNTKDGAMSDTTKFNLANSGIFDKNLAKTPAVNANQTQNGQQKAEEKIETIKNEIGQGNPNEIPVSSSQQKANPDSLPPIYADHSSIFAGSEGSFNFDKARVEYQDLNKMVVPKELLSKIPENIARSYKAVPFAQQEDIVSVAMVDPEDVETREMIKRLLGEKIKIFLATESDINSVLSQYQGLESEVSSAIASTEDEEEDNKKDKDKLISESVSDDAPAAKIVSSLLKRAIRDKASDVHIEPTEKEVEVRFRLDGMLRKKVSLPKDIQAAVISRIKILSNMKIDEQRVPQDGRFNMHVDNRRVDFRVSSMPVAFGEKMVMRILDKESGILTIEQLGIRGNGLKTLEVNLTKSHGMVLVTGPTGSGKSTSLYAMIQKVYNEGVNIITLEDPIEYQMRGINQSQVNSEIGYSFAAGLRSILRQDPDIIMLGEIRDRETAEMAVHAALTGHVVLSTLHTNDAAGAAPRMIDMGVEPFLITSSINVVVGQRLVRTICPDCKEEIKLADEEMAAIQKEVDSMPENEKNEIMSKGLKFFKGKGCKSCENSGYKGRIGIYEVLNITPEMQQLILKRVSSNELNNLAISQGMTSMIQDGILKVCDGITSMEEVWRATKN